VEVGDVKQHISRASVQFFIDWVQERMGRIKLDDPDQKNAVRKHHARAKQVWRMILETANAD